MFKRYLFALGISLPLIAAGQPSTNAISSIKLERTACFGTCPVYIVTIFSDGRLEYDGHKFVKVEGTRTKSIPVAQFQRLEAKVNEIEFFKLESSYRANVTDLPTTYVTVTRGTESKRVEDYYGAPERLHELEKLIDQVADVGDWVEVNRKTSAVESER